MIIGMGGKLYRLDKRMAVPNQAEIAAAITVSELIEAVADAMDSCELCYGHGTDNAVDEAAALVFHVCELDHGFAEAGYTRNVSEAQRGQVLQLLAERIDTHRPLAYLLGEETGGSEHPAGSEKWRRMENRF